MKTYIKFLIIIIMALPAMAQTTAIPDTQFEQTLIDEGIDSDGTVNGQVLTSDIVGVLNLNLEDVQDLTGLQDFAALETLKLDEGGGLLFDDITVDLTANTNLKIVEIISFRGLSTLDLTGLISLEELRLREWQGDVITMEIDSLDLSTNTNIDKVDLGVVEYLKYINLQNGNNINMFNFELDLDQDGQGLPMPDRPMCIKVDDAAAATANTAPYDSWIIYDIAPTFYDSGVCNLSVNQVKAVEVVALYPNPVENTLNIEYNSNLALQKIRLVNMQGKLVSEYSDGFKNLDVSDLSAGIYLLQIYADQGKITKKVVVR